MAHQLRSLPACIAIKKRTKRAENDEFEPENKNNMKSDTIKMTTTKIN